MSWRKMFKLKTTNYEIKKALDFATNAHAGVFRDLKGYEIPYINHPIEIAVLIQRYHPENKGNLYYFL